MKETIYVILELKKMRYIFFTTVDAISKIKSLELSFNIDGVPLSKSRLSFLPILLSGIYFIFCE